MNSKQLGLLGELKAQYDFIKAGWDVSIPLGDYCTYDFIAIKNNKSLRIQVKTTEIIHHDEGIMKFSVTSANYYVNKIYTEKDCDYFYLYCLENEKGYLYSLQNGTRTDIFLRIYPPKNNQKKGINFAENFEFSKIIQEIQA